MPLEFRKIGPDMRDALSEFFRFVEVSGDVKYFHPHPMTDEQAIKLCAYDGKDLYYLAMDDGRILAYGMLRGWDEGYAIPSLGIYVHPSDRGTGLAKAFMMFLHAAAKICGAEKIRLKVYPENLFAVRLYNTVGYESSGEEAGQMVMFVDLKAQGKADPEGRVVRRERSQDGGFIECGGF